MLAHSLWRKLGLMLGVGVAVVWMYEATVLDSRFAGQPAAEADAAPPEPGARLLFSATGYCKGTTTASGVNVRSGIAAADPDLLPVGSVIQIDAPGTRYDGVYTVMDTGPKVQGRHVDLYMWSCHEALRFGRTAVRIVVLRLGWNPAHSSPTLVDSLFRRRESAARRPPATEPAPSPGPAAAPSPAAPASPAAPGPPQD
jgi:3D (Asp-Asp-Asp) domain-containing protein